MKEVRNKQIRIRLIQKEFDDIHVIANGLGMIVSEYIRHMCVNTTMISCKYCKFSPCDSNFYPCFTCDNFERKEK